MDGRMGRMGWIDCEEGSEKEENMIKELKKNFQSIVKSMHSLMIIMMIVNQSITPICA